MNLNRRKSKHHKGESRTNSQMEPKHHHHHDDLNRHPYARNKSNMNHTIDARQKEEKIKMDRKKVC